MTPLELTQRLRVLEAEVTALRNRLGALEAKPVVSVQEVVAEKKSERKMCPHCGVKPNHFFHVQKCRQEKNKNNGRTEEAIRR